MLIFIGADHKGFKLKESVKKFLYDSGYQPIDVGNAAYDEKDDYPDFAEILAKKIQGDFLGGRGILICGSGAGMDIVANKFEGIRAALALNANQIFDARSDDDINVLCLAADFTESDKANEFVKVFLQTPFSGKEEHQRRIQKIREIELNK